MPGLVDDTAIDDKGKAAIKQSGQGKHCICDNSRNSLNDFYQQTIRGLNENGEHYLKQQRKKGIAIIYPSAIEDSLWGASHHCYTFAEIHKIQGNSVHHAIGYELDIQESGAAMQQVVVVGRVTCMIYNGGGLKCFSYPRWANRSFQVPR